MNVKELREMLQAMEAEGHADKDVLFTYNYGDHWRTQVAVKVDSCEEGTVEYSSYHQMDKVVEDDGDDYEEDYTPNDRHRQVVIIG